MKILIVDDDLGLRKSLRNQLELLGHTVLDAADGLSAFMALKSNSDIDSIITDYRMPVLGGRDWIELLRYYHPDLPIVVTSAYDFAGEDLGENMVFVQKPFDIEEISTVLLGAKRLHPKTA